MPKGVYVRDRNKKPFGPKLTPEQDQEISKLYLAGATQQELSQKFQSGRRQILASLRRTGTSTEGRKGSPGERNPSWRGGRIIDQDGYVRIYSPGHPYAKKNHILEHRLVMEQVLGRYLDPKEVVHHKDGNKQNNSPENLVVFRSNGVHLGVELFGKVPKWTEEGKKRIADRSVPSMQGIPQSPAGTGALGLRRRKIQKFLHETSDLESIGPVVELELPPGYRRKGNGK